MKILKTILFAIILSIFIFCSLVLTQSKLFWPIINWIMENRGTRHLQGEDRGMETFSISFEIILPVIFAISLIVVWTFINRKNTK